MGSPLLRERRSSLISTLVGLEPERRGGAVLAHGGSGAEEAGAVLDAIVERWPAVVLRLPADHGGGGGAIPVLPLVPGDLLPDYGAGAVYQRSGWRVPAPEGAIILPRPRRSTIGMLLTGTAPPPRDRWIAAWRSLWDRA